MMRRVGAGLMVIGLALVIGAGTSYAGEGPKVDPTIEEFDSKARCGDADYLFIKDIPPSNGEYKSEDGYLTFTVTGFTDDNKTTFSWSSNVGVDAVYVKGGDQGGNLYKYDPPTEQTSDSGLHPPTTGNDNQIANVSHIDVCYDKEDEEASPTPGTEASPTPPGGGGGGGTDPSPTPTPGSGGGGGGTGGAGGGGGGELPTNGSNSMQMAALAMLLVALGLTLQFEARRRSAKT